MKPPKGSVSTAHKEERPADLLGEIPAVVRAPRTDSIYNCHAYLTKVPVDAIKPFIEALTRPGETVVDMFAGSGMTGIAATSLQRSAAMSDISVLGQHIARGYLTRVSPSETREAAALAISSARAELGEMYLTFRLTDGQPAEMIRTIWSFCYRCPSCGHLLTYFESLDDAGRPPVSCATCGFKFARRSWPRTEDCPVRVVVLGESGKQVEQAVQPCDLEHLERARLDPRQEKVPSYEIAKDREMFGRSGLRRAGISSTAQFFTARNALALLFLWESIAATESSWIRQKLRFAFTACLARASKRYQWGPKRPLNAQNQTYYIAPVYFEWNVFDLFQRKVEAALRSDDLLFGNAPLFVGDVASRCSYDLASADALDHLEAESVDYVFTDPPFGSNIFYSDMNLFHEAWLGRPTDHSREAVVHTSGPKKNGAADRYERLLHGAFSEAFRILKPGRHMSVVFGNSSGAIWALVQRALRDAGFSEPVHLAILDKGQRSVKGLNSGSESVVTVDLVLTVQKPGKRAIARQSSELPASIDLSELLAAASRELDVGHKRNPSYIYAAALREAIRRGLSLEGLHYSDVLIGLRQRGFAIDPGKGLLSKPLSIEALAAGAMNASP